MAEANWDAVDNALIAWVERTTGFPAGRVIWDQQDGGTRPPRPFATLRKGGDNTIGYEAELTVGDNGEDPPEGEELILDSAEQNEFTLVLTFFTVDTIGSNSAYRIAKRVRASVSTERTLNDFDAAQLALVDRAPVENLTEMLDTGLEGQAAFDVRLRIADGTSETATFIETASMTGEVE